MLDKTSGDVNVNTHVTSSQHLRSAIDSIKAELESRTKISKTLLADQMKHISDEVDANGPVPLALEHLELYKAHLCHISVHPVPCLL